MFWAPGGHLKSAMRFTVAGEMMGEEFFARFPKPVGRNSTPEEQAWARAGGAVGNRGEEAAEAALQMADWIRSARAGRRR